MKISVAHYNGAYPLCSTKELLKQCNYLSMRQMIYFYYMATVHKTVEYKTPEYLHKVLCKALSSGVQHRYPTSTAGTRQVAEARLAVANSSFRWRASTQYAALPANLKTEQSMQSFLNGLRMYTMENVNI